MDRVYEESEIDSAAAEVLSSLDSRNSSAVVSLTGDLGAGKTTLVQSIAKALGVQERIVSPTFVIMKKYATTDPKFKTLYHIDAYRIENTNELLPLGFEHIVKESNALVIVEWGERIKTALPSGAHFFTIEHKDMSRRIYERS